MEGLTLQELKKRYEKLNKKKGYRGWYESQVKVNPNAGNVPLNNAIFNMAMGSAKSVNMAQVNADSFVGDAPATSVAGAAPDGGIGMVGVAEGYEPNKIQESFNGDRINEVIRNFGTISKLTADDWRALKSTQPGLERIQENLWMYGNEIRALMDYAFSGYDAYEVQHTYGNVIGVGVNRVLKELQQNKEFRENLQENKENKIELALQTLGEGEELRFKNIGNGKTLTVKLNPKSPDYYVLFNYDENGNIMNLIKYSDLDNTIYWTSQYDMIFDKKEKRFIEL